MNEDHDPLNPANQDELPEFSSLDLEECLDYCKDTGDFEPLENAIFENRRNIKRLKEIKEIENNNGWIKIESIEDLPKEKGLKCLFLNKNNMHTTYISDDVLSDSDWFFRKYTHWKIKNEFKYPLY